MAQKETRTIEVKTLGLDGVIKEFDKLSKHIKAGTIIPREVSASYKDVTSLLKAMGNTAKDAGKQTLDAATKQKAALKHLQNELKKTGKAATLGLTELASIDIDTASIEDFNKALGESEKKVKKVSEIETDLVKVNDRMEKLAFTTKEFPMELRKIVRGFSAFSSTVAKIDIASMTPDQLEKDGDKLKEQVGLYEKVTGGLDSFIRAQQALQRIQAFPELSDEVKIAAIDLENFNGQLAEQIRLGNSNSSAFQELTGRIDKTRRELDLMNFKNLIDESNKFVSSGIFDEAQEQRVSKLAGQLEEVRNKMHEASLDNKQLKFDELSKDAEYLQQQLVKVTEETRKQLGMSDKLASLQRNYIKGTKKEAKQQKMTKKDLVKSMKDEEKGDKKKLGFLATALGWRRRERVAKAVMAGKSDKEVKEAGKGTRKRAGGAALKGAAGLGKGAMGAAAVVAAPALAMASFAGMAAALLDMNGKVKKARRNLSQMGMETGELFGKSAKSMIRQSEVWRRQLTDTGIAYSMTMDEVYEKSAVFSKEGFMIEDTANSMGSLIAQSSALNVSMGELASMGGGIREEFGGALDSSLYSIIKLKDQVQGTGLTVTRFMSKVINAASGMGLYRGKIEEVSKAFSGMAKASTLPEKIATEAIGKIVTGTKNLDVGMQNIIGQTPHMQKVAETLKAFNTATDAGDAEGLKKAKEALATMGIDQREIENLNKMNDGYNKNIALVRAVSAERSSLGRIEAMTRTLIPGFDITADNAADKLGDAMNKNLVEFEKLGEQFGMGKDEIQVLKDWAQVVASNVNVSKSLGTTLLDSKMSDDERTAAIKENSKKLAGKKGEGLAKILMDNVATSESIAKSLNTTSDQLITDLNSSDTKTRKKAEEGVKEQLSKMDSGLENSKRIMADAAALAEKKANERLEKERRYRTKSIMEALELILQGLIEKIYLALEGLWNFIQRHLPPITIALKRGFAWLIKILSFGNTAMQDFAKKLEDKALKQEIEYRESVADQREASMDKKEEKLKARMEKLESASKTDPGNKKLREKSVEARKEYENYLNKEMPVIKKQIAAEREKIELDRKYVDAYDKMDLYDKEVLKAKKKELDKAKKETRFISKRESESISGIDEKAEAKFQKKKKAKIAKLEKEFDTLRMGGKVEEKKQGGGFLGGASMSGDKLAFAGNSGELVLNRPNQMTLGKKIYDLAQGKPAGFGAAGATGGGGGIGKQINDNRNIVINVNQRDQETIKNIVYNALYEDKM